MFTIWHHMMERCFNLKVKHFSRYGGRGITVCDRWRTFENFLADMGQPPNGLTIERKNNNGNYEPGNCRWATYKEQARNTSRNRVETVRGVTAPLSELCERFGTNYSLVSQRLNASGWDIDRAFFEPKRHW